MSLRMFGLPIIFFGLIILFSPAHLLSQISGGQIQGTIVSPDGQPVSRASVTAQLQRSPGTAPFRASVFTEPDGSFLVPNVPPGAYWVCVQVPGTTLLNPCTWSAAPPAVSVEAGQTASLGALALEAGYLVRVRLQDAGRLLQSDEGQVPGARVQSGVWTPNGLFIPMRVRTKGPASRDLELPVPFGRPLELSVSSPRFELADENNARIDPAGGSSIAIQAEPGAPSRVHTFHVTGRKAAP